MHGLREHLDSSAQEVFRDVTSTEHGRFSIRWAPFAVVEGDDLKPIFVRYDEAEPPELHLVTAVIVGGAASVEVTPIDLTHLRLGELPVAHAEFEALGQQMTMVAIRRPDGDYVTLRQEEGAQFTRPVRPPRPAGGAAEGTTPGPTA